MQQALTTQTTSRGRFRGNIKVLKFPWIDFRLIISHKLSINVSLLFKRRSMLSRTACKFHVKIFTVYFNIL